MSVFAEFMGMALRMSIGKGYLLLFDMYCVYTTVYILGIVCVDVHICTCIHVFVECLLLY